MSLRIPPHLRRIVALSLMEVRAVQPASDGVEYPILSMDPDFDDLPATAAEGTHEDEITQEAILRLADAAIAVIWPTALKAAARLAEFHAGVADQRADVEEIIGHRRFRVMAHKRSRATLLALARDLRDAAATPE